MEYPLKSSLWILVAGESRSCINSVKQENQYDKMQEQNQGRQDFLFNSMTFQLLASALAV